MTENNESAMCEIIILNHAPSEHVRHVDLTLVFRAKVSFESQRGTSGGAPW